MVIDYYDVLKKYSNKSCRFPSLYHEYNKKISKLIEWDEIDQYNFEQTLKKGRLNNVYNSSYR